MPRRKRQSQRQYARGRAERGLPAASRGALRYAIESGRIHVDEDGRLDPAEADRVLGEGLAGDDTGDPLQAATAAAFALGAKTVAAAVLAALPEIVAGTAVLAGCPMRTAFALARLVPAASWEVVDAALAELAGRCRQDGGTPLGDPGPLALEAPPDPDWRGLAELAGERVNIGAWTSHLTGLQRAARQEDHHGDR